MDSMKWHSLDFEKTKEAYFTILTEHANNGAKV